MKQYKAVVWGILFTFVLAACASRSEEAPPVLDEQSKTPQSQASTQEEPEEQNQATEEATKEEEAVPEDTSLPAEEEENEEPLSVAEAGLETFLTASDWDPYTTDFGDHLTITFGEGRVFTFTADEEYYAGSYRLLQLVREEEDAVIDTLDLTLTSWPDGMDIYAVGGSIRVYARVEQDAEYLTIVSNSSGSAPVPSIFDPYYDAFGEEEVPEAICDRVTFSRPLTGLFTESAGLHP